MTSKQGSFCLTGGANDPELFKPGGAEEDGEENESIAELNTITRKELFSSEGCGERRKQIVSWEPATQKKLFSFKVKFDHACHCYEYVKSVNGARSHGHPLR
jgi:hypothetical protein